MKDGDYLIDRMGKRENESYRIDSNNYTERNSNYLIVVFRGEQTNIPLEKFKELESKNHGLILISLIVKEKKICSSLEYEEKDTLRKLLMARTHIISSDLTKFKDQLKNARTKMKGGKEAKN
jgi:hypothetical protein